MMCRRPWSFFGKADFHPKQLQSPVSLKSAKPVTLRASGIRASTRLRTAPQDGRNDLSGCLGFELRAGYTQAFA
jgi:hypothetical protein